MQQDFIKETKELSIKIKLSINNSMGNNKALCCVNLGCWVLLCNFKIQV